jgi:Na+/H+ antiporter NhaD/arsenite permease-like protein
MVAALAIAAGRVRWLSVDPPAAALLGMMILAAHLGEAGLFRWASWRVIRAAGTPRSAPLGVPRRAAPA